MSVNIILTPPPGESIDYVNSVDRGYQVLDTNWVSISLATALVILRLWVRLRITRNIGWDDYCMVVSLLCSISVMINDGFVIIRYGIGHHSWNVPLENYEPSLNLLQIGLVMYLMSIMLAKVSILLFYRRLFGINKVFRWTAYVIMIFVVIYCLSCSFAIVFQCSPPAATWDLLLRLKSHCVSVININIVIGGLNIGTDVVILLLPIPMLWKLHLPLPQKVGLMAVMATGIFVCTTAIVREVILVTTFNDMDEAWTVCDSMIWMSLELNIGIFCGCLPTLNPLFRLLKESKGSSISYLQYLKPFRVASNASSNGITEHIGQRENGDLIEKKNFTYRGLVERISSDCESVESPRHTVEWSRILNKSQVTRIQDPETG